MEKYKNMQDIRHYNYFMCGAAHVLLQHMLILITSISRFNVSVKSEFVRFLWDHCELIMTSMRMRHLRSDKTSVESSWDEQNMDDYCTRT